MPAEKVAWIIADMTRGTIQRRLLGPTDTPPSEDSEFLLSFIWAALTIKLNPVPTNNSSDRKERPIHRGIKESRELLGGRGL